MPRIVILSCAALLFGYCQASADNGAIGDLLKDKQEVKVYINEVKDESGDKNVSTGAFKKQIEESLLSRRATAFKVVRTPADSDIQISAVIKKFQYLARGPMKAMPFIETQILDAAATMSSNFVEMAVHFTVIDSKTGNVLWDRHTGDYIKKVMTLQESGPMIYEKIARTFLWKCFGRARPENIVKGPI